MRKILVGLAFVLVSLAFSFGSANADEGADNGYYPTYDVCVPSGESGNYHERTIVLNPGNPNFKVWVVEHPGSYGNPLGLECGVNPPV